MPVYCYKCRQCDLEFEVRHSMNFEDQICIECESEDVFKIPQGNYISPNKEVSPKRTGKVVDRYIEDVKKEVELEKKKLRSEIL